MPGYGPAPKEPGKRARRNVDPSDPKTIEFVKAEQPELPEGDDYPEWHPQTRIWWAMWGRSPQSVHFMESDWDELLATATLHTSFWRKANFNVAAELRLRVAKFGATPEDRARLRMHFADADEKDSKRPPRPAASNWGDLRALPEAK